MRVVIDTNVLISALLSASSLPAHLILMWREGLFDLLTTTAQLNELIRVTRYPKIGERLAPAVAGRLINQLRDVAILIENPAITTRSPDPDDNLLLGIALTGSADFLISGDKRDLLALRLFEGTKIITVRDFLTLHRRLP